MPLGGIRVSARWLSIFSLATLAIVLIGCTGQAVFPADPGRPAPGFFPIVPTSEQGQYVYDFYPVVFWLAVAVFVLVEGLLLWIVLRYRRQSSDTELPTQTHGNSLLEVLWTLIPAVIVTGLFLFTVNTLAKVEPTGDARAQPDLVIDVKAFQWQWTFDYPAEELSFTGSGSTGPVMVLPTDETVRIRLHAEDVIHSFYVPQFLYKKDAIPGRVNEFDVVVREPGTFGGQCAEFCGLGHANMHFTVQAMSRADFDAWVAENQKPKPSQAPPPSGAQTLALTSVGIVEGFQPATLTLAAGQPWVVELTNSDSAAPHDFSIRGGNADGSDWLGEPDAVAGGSAVYQPPPLAAATYEFYCSIHPNMTGSLTVQ